MNRGGEQLGYTVVEVMIFLVISSMLFIGAMIAIGGQQEKTQFAQAMRDIDSKIQSTIGEIYSGYYPSFTNIKCSALANSTNPPSFALAAGSQGTNSECIFMGKTFQFAVSGSNGESYNVFSVAGRRYKQNTTINQEVDSMAEALPRAIFNGSVDLTETNYLKWGLHVTKVTKATTNTDLAMFGFISSVGTYNSAGTDLVSGAQKIDLVALVGGLNKVKATAANDVNTLNTADAANGVTVCFNSANNKQKGSITIGQNDGKYSTVLGLDSQISGLCP